MTKALRLLGILAAAPLVPALPAAIGTAAEATYPEETSYADPTTYPSYPSSISVYSVSTSADPWSTTAYPSSDPDDCDPSTVYETTYSSEPTYEPIVDAPENGKAVAVTVTAQIAVSAPAPAPVPAAASIVAAAPVSHVKGSKHSGNHGGKGGHHGKGSTANSGSSQSSGGKSGSAKGHPGKSGKGGKGSKGGKGAPSAPGPASPGGNNFASGVGYSPYSASGGCNSESQIASDLRNLQQYDVIRVYGTDCNQIANVLAAMGPNQQLLAGIYDLTDTNSEAQSLIQQVNGNWSRIYTVSVGNEAVNSGTATVSQVVSAIGSVRSTVRAAGYKGPVVTVDTMNAVVDNPELCTASDYCAINCHAFFDSSATPSSAGSFVRGWVDQVQKIAGPKKMVVVTESGWPTQGQTNGAAVPSEANMKTAVASLKAAFKQNLILYSAYNTLWQPNAPGTFGTNQYWGILGTAPSDQ